MREGHTDHGAKGDGISDDTGAITAVIRLASQYPGLLPRGIYRLKHALDGELLSRKGISDLR